MLKPLHFCNLFVLFHVFPSAALMSSVTSSGPSWEGMWARGIKPGEAFDAAKAETALLAIIPGSGVSSLGSTASLDLVGKHAFVPGCGRGYSVEALSDGGCATVVGLELASTAVAEALSYLESTGKPASGITIAEGDFFAHSPAQKYDLIYDCTFLCAIPPERRTEWALKMKELLVKGGDLVTLIFPVKDGAPDPADGEIGSGPPFAMSPRLLDGLLLPLGFTKISCERVPEALVTRPFAGEYIARWYLE